MKDRVIYMLEPDEDDQFITRSFIAENGLKVNVRYLDNSNDLFRELETRQDLPSLILVNLRSVPENGLTVVSRLKSDSRYSAIPVTILSDATSTELVNECYRNGVNGFINKPFTRAETMEKIKQFFNYWFNVAELPS